MSTGDRLDAEARRNWDRTPAVLARVSIMRATMVMKDEMTAVLYLLEAFVLGAHLRKQRQWPAATRARGCT